MQVWDGLPEASRICAIRSRARVESASGASRASDDFAGDSMTKVWLITGNCRALVQALAEAVLASGHNLVATTIDTEPLKELVERYGDQLRILPIDVADGSAAETAIEATIGAFGRLDVLVLDFAKWRRGATYKALKKKVGA
jgi:NAD(P)-dependent dehydrogenase (short-subunit alcohol dehydrogenase family)